MFNKASASRTNGIAMRESAGFDNHAFLKNVESLLEKHQEKISDLLDERLERHKADILETVAAGTRDGGFHGDGDDRLSSENLFYKRTNSFGSGRLSSSSNRSFPLTEAHLRSISDRHNNASLGSTPKSTYSSASSAANSCGSAESDSKRTRVTPVVAIVDCITPDSTHLAHPWTELDEEFIKPLSEEMEKAMDSVEYIAKFAKSDMIYMRRVLMECNEGCEKEGYSIPLLDGLKINSYLDSIMLRTEKIGTETNYKRITIHARTEFLNFIRRSGADYFNPRAPSHSGSTEDIYLRMVDRLSDTIWRFMYGYGDGFIPKFKVYNYTNAEGTKTKLRVLTNKEIVNTFKIQHQEKKKYLNKRRVSSMKIGYEGREVAQLLPGRKPKREGHPLPRAFSSEKLLDTAAPCTIFGSDPKKRKRGQLEKARIAAEATGGSAKAMDDSDSGEDGDGAEEEPFSSQKQDGSQEQDDEEETQQVDNNNPDYEED